MPPARIDAAAPVIPPAALAAARPARRSWLWLVSILVTVGAGAGFTFKLAMFAREAMGAEAASFALVPILVYLMVAAGFLAFFVWALLRGQFRDVEGPKHRILAKEEEYERDGI